MAEDQESNINGDGSSYFQRTVILKDWWLIKCSKEFEGKRFGVAGTEITSSVETRAMRVFTSSPIIKALDVFTVQASDGICITLRGFINRERVAKSGFNPDISHDFIFGFPPCWETICNSYFGGVSFGTDTNTVPSTIDKACCPILSPCKNTRGKLEDSPAESRDKSTVTKTNATEINNKDGRSGGSRAKNTKPARRKSLRHSNSVEMSEVQTTASDRDDGNEGLNKAKSIDVEENECVAINNEVISPMNGCVQKYSSTDGVESKDPTKESLTSEHRKGKLKVTKTSLHSLSKDFNNSSKPTKKGKLKKSETTLDWNVVEPVNHSGSKTKEADENSSGEKTKRKIDFDVEVTPVKEEKKQKTSVVSSDSLGQKRSRSGRVLVSTLEFWRNQVPVYDMDRNLVQVKEGHETKSPASKGKGSDSRKPRKIK